MITDAAYIDNLMDVFASFDTDGSGTIDEEEFEQLYAHLGGPMESQTRKSRSATAKQEMDPVYAEFKKYDTRNNGFLSHYEVGEMMKAMGYKVTQEYLQGTMDAFGSFDKDDDGVVDFEEFKPMYDHLGGNSKTVDHTTEEDAARHAHPLWELFSQHDGNGNGVLSQHDVMEMMATMGYKAKADYIQETLKLFGEFDGDGDHVSITQPHTTMGSQPDLTGMCTEKLLVITGHPARGVWVALAAPGRRDACRVCGGGAGGGGGANA